MVRFRPTPGLSHPRQPGSPHPPRAAHQVPQGTRHALGELEEEGWHKILIIGADKLFIDRIQELLPEDDDFKYELANSGFEAGIQAESFHPDTIIIDLAMGRSEGLQIAQNLRRNPQYELTLIISMASEDEAAPETLVNFGFNEVFKKPFDVALLGERIRSLVEEKRANL